MGNALMDLQVRVSESALSKLNLRKGGMQLVSVADQQQVLRTLQISEIAQASGGSAANTIIAFAQLGGKTAYGCLVGDDEFGTAYRQEMTELQIALPNTPMEGKPTGTCLVLITPDAERTMNTALGVSAEFSEADINTPTIAESEWVYLEGYLLSTELGQHAALEAAKLAKEFGAKVAVTFSDAFIVNIFGEPLRAVLKYADLVFANAVEAAAFAQTNDEDSAFRALSALVPNVVMTMSERGARFRYLNEEGFAQPFPVKPVDLTGAGDMFAGAFLYGITHNMTAAVSAKLACFLASRVVSQLGPRLPGLEKLPELKNLLDTERSVGEAP